VPSIDLAGRQFGTEPEPPAPMRPAEVFDTEIVKGTFAVPAPDSEGISPEATQTRLSEAAAKQSNERSPTSTPGTSANSGRTATGNPAGSAATGSASGNTSRNTSGNTAGNTTGDPSGNLTSNSTGAGLTFTGNPDARTTLPSPTSLTDPDPELLRPMDPTERAARETQQQIATILDEFPVTPIDDKLTATLETYRDPKEPGKLYYKVAIQPRAGRQMPIIPKDIVWVQDVSGSITEERLLFCRRALTAALETMNPQDRFSVIAFRNTIITASQGWLPVTPENIKKASNFIGGMRSFGSTDIFGSLKTLMTLPRDPQRPMLVLIVTDGKPTAGLTESSEIIGAFSRLNSGMMSIYMYGTHKDANIYLIDMLTYCNRGTSEIVKGNRWDIPTSMATLYSGFRNPIMSDVSINFDSASKSEFYPFRTANLYQDSPMEFFGVCPANEAELIFQARGLAFDKSYDSVFRLPLSSAKTGKADIKTRWARQKMFHLASIYSRDAKSKDEMLNAMRRHSQTYGVPMPYPTNVK